MAMDIPGIPYDRLPGYGDSEDSGGLANIDVLPQLSTGRFVGETSHASSFPPSTRFESRAFAKCGSRGQLRQKKSRKTSWLVLTRDGERQTITVDKRQLVQAMGVEIPMRDMRLLDPALQTFETNRGQMLVRDNALVFSMEYVRLIIMADKVLMPLDFEKSAAIERFTSALEGALRERGQSEHGSEDGTLNRSSVNGVHSALGLEPETLPFELQVLELALGEICRHLAQQVNNLDSVAHPALDALTRSADTLNLERVRKIKTQHQRLDVRLSSVRDTLQRYLEDDQDMWRMCLTKKMEQDLEASTPGAVPSAMETSMTVARLTSFRRHSIAVVGRSPLERINSRSMTLPDVDGTLGGSLSSDDVHEFLEVEHLLESYFMLSDSLLQRLTSIGEYIDDTEDLINIELDYSRNRLIRIEIVITTATFMLSFFNLAAGVLGENVEIPEMLQTFGFWGINFTMTCLVLSSFALTCFAMKRNKLI